jgi:hypothetical protein
MPEVQRTGQRIDQRMDERMSTDRSSEIHECVYVEEQEPSGRLILPPCLICGTTAMDAIEQIRGDVLVIHKPAQLWTEAEVLIDEVTGERVETQEALYDDAGELVHAPDVRTVCEGCDPRNDVPWPCPTARAVGVSE